MALDTAALAQGCGGALRTADQLCRRQVDAFRAGVASGAAVTVGCTQEAPLFTEVAGELGAQERVAFVNIREAAGWSNEGLRAGPKMAALLAAAARFPRPPRWSRWRAKGWRSSMAATRPRSRLHDGLPTTSTSRCC
jgi:hypothetical protein